MLKNIKLLFILLILFSFLLFGSLLVGIKIEQFSFYNINVSKLYLKLDKKLILHIQSLQIPIIKSSAQNSTDAFKQYLHYLPLLLERFERIHIENLHIQNNQMSITLDNDIFYIDNTFINVAARPVLKKEGVILDLYSIYLKDYDLLFDGAFYHIYNGNAFEFEGNAYYKQVQTNLKASSFNDEIDFEIQSKKEFQSIDFVKDFVRLNPIIEAWTYDNVSGDIKLESLKGKLDRQTFMPKIASFEGKAYISDAKIRFNPKANVVKTPKVTVRFEKDNLYFDLENPHYNQTNINGSKVAIYSLSQGAQPSNIVISLQTKSALNSDVLEILKAYNITLPLIQQNGTTDSKLDIKVVFKGTKLSTQGVFKVQNADFKLGNLPFYAYDATVVLDNEMVHIKDAYVNIDDFLKANVNLSIDTKKRQATGEANIESLSIKTKQSSVVELQNFQTNLALDYTNNSTVRLELAQLFTTLDITKEATFVSMQSLQTLYPHAVLLQNLKIQEGILKLKLINKNEIYVDALLQNFDFPIVTKEGNTLNSLEIQGDIIDDALHFYTPNKDIEFISKNNQNSLYLNNLDIKKPNSVKNKEGSLSNMDIQIKGTNSDIWLNSKQKLLAQSYDLVFKKDEIALDLQHNNSNFSFLQQQERMNIFGLQLSDTFMNHFLGIKNLFLDGEFTLNATGNKDSLQGSVDITNSKVKDLAILNNLITLINTTPGLINPLLAIPAFVGMVGNDGFNLNGYRITKGVLDFTYDLSSEMFFIEKLDTIGNMVDFKAVGLLNLKNKTINADAMVIFLKDYSNLIDYIPVVNYLLLGKERNISTLVKIQGNIENPEIQTNLSKEAISAPLNFIKRIFNLPTQGLELLQPKK